MRSICKKGPAILAAALALCALTAASASAAQWYVGGKALTGSEKLAETVKVEEPVKFNLAGTDEAEYPTLTCTGMVAGKSEIGASGTIKLGTAKFTGCAVHEPGNEFCKLEEQPETIGLLALEAKMAVGKSPEDASEFTATNSTKLWTEFVTNEECNVLSTYNPIKGSVTLQAPKGQTEVAEQEFIGHLTTGLKWYSQTVYLSGKVKLKLASGKAWSFH
jgi:hypothetical protein